MTKPDLSKEKFSRWFRSRGLVSKADVMRYGLDHGYIRADREIRRIVECGEARKIEPEECERRNLRTSMAWYEPAEPATGWHKDQMVLICTREI